MELAVHCKQSRIVPLVSWAPRLFNREEDVLANGRTQALSPALEVKLNPGDLRWRVPVQVLAMGQKRTKRTEHPGRWENSIGE